MAAQGTAETTLPTILRKHCELPPSEGILDGFFNGIRKNRSFADGLVNWSIRPKARRPGRARDGRKGPDNGPLPERLDTVVRQA
jgi:hypothetical protein